MSRRDKLGRNLWFRIGALGAASGMRASSGPVFVSQAAARGDLDLSGTVLAPLAAPAVSTLMPLLFAGELVGDKLPMAVDRTWIGALAGRIASGALAGAALSISARRTWWPGAILGASAAVAAAYAGQYGRAAICARTGLPDPVVAIAEDALVWGIAAAATNPGD